MSQHDAVTENEKTETPAEAKLFQEAYQKMAMLKRTDDQIVQLRQRKATLVDELKTVQSRLNDEIGRLLDATEEPATSLHDTATMPAIRAA